MIVYLRIQDKETADALEKAAEGAGLFFREVGEYQHKRVLDVGCVPDYLRSADDFMRRGHELSRVSGGAAPATEARDPESGTALGFDTIGEGE